MLAANVTSITMDGEPFTQAQDSATLLIAHDTPTGNYVFVVTTVGGTVYEATLEWVEVT